MVKRMKMRNKKTGEIKDFGNLQVYAEAEGTDDSQLLGNFDSFEQILEYYEDYIPSEPLIKDEKVRKAVRAWAEANDIEDGITYLGDGEFRSYLNTTIDFAILVNEHRFDLLKKNEEYTIPELCGEEGE